MTTIRTFLIASGACLSLAACDFLIARDRDAPPAMEADTPAEVPEPATDPSESAPETADTDGPVVVASTATIDWDAARADMAARSGEDRETGFQVASGNSAPPVPVLLPTGIVVAQSAENGVRFQPMSDGYFAYYPGIDYDIVVNGTNEVFGTTGDAEDGDAPDLMFTPTMTGAQVTFSRYGADYLVEFECKAAQTAEGVCITEQEALEITEKLVIAGTR
ncbi:hypothetical protein [Hyphomonas sp.]|uniref:hypothetical protein n=1 Tax=Hyphomonas sp. TaxID=87 RepID=UPI0025BA5421|nr:hypothetical protein [Hyphomonas sp.]